MTTVDALRRWARGSYPLEAGVELLARSFGGLVKDYQPWIAWDDEGVLVDVVALHSAVTAGGYSGGETRVLLVVASLLSSEYPVSLGMVLPGLDREHVALVLAAVAHASGSHEDCVLTRTGDAATFTRPGSLYPWPED